MIEETLHLKEQQSGILPSLVENSFQAFDEFYNAEEQKDQTRSIHTFIPPISVPLYNGFPRGTGLGEFMSGSSEQLMSYIFNQGLVKADIQGQNLHKLPDDLIMQTGIAKLNVSSNYLNRIDSPSDIALFKTIGQTLRNLIISNNILTEISRDLLSTCQNLEFIDVSHNLLRDISFVRGLRSLRELDIRHNRILHLDNSLNSLPSLVDLRFDWPSMIASRYTGASTVTQANTICLNELKDKVARHDMYYYRHFTEDYDTQGMTEALIKSSVWQQQVFVLSISNTNSDLLEYSVNNDCHRSMIGMLDKLNDTNRATFGSACLSKAIILQRENIVRSLSGIEINPRWTDSEGNNLIHLIFKDNSMDYSLKLVALDQLVNRNVNMHELNKDRETPLMTAINLKNRLNCNALLAVEHNDNQRAESTINQKMFRLDELDQSDNNLLHLAVRFPNLSVMHRILKSYSRFSLLWNNEIKIPVQLISRSFLTSRKLLLGCTRELSKNHFRPIICSPMNYKTSFTATKAGNFRATGGMPIVRDLSEMVERHSASQYRMMLQEIDSFLMTKYAYFDTEVCKTMASDCPDIGQINHKMFLVEYKQFLKKSSGKKHHSIAKSESKKFISQMRDTAESSNYDSILLGKISNLVSDASESRGLQLIPVVIRLIGLLSNISDKQLAISKLIGAYQDLDERPRDSESSVLSHKYALSLVFSSLEIIY